MGYNVAGTQALGDYLVSQIQNTRLLFGESPLTGIPAGGTPASPAATGSAPGEGGTPPSPSSTQSQLAQDLAAARLANAQTLFGITPSGANSPQAAGLPTIAGQTPRQVEQVAIQSSLIAEQFANTSTLFSSIGLGGNLNRLA